MEWDRAVRITLGSVLIADFDSSRPFKRGRALDASFSIERLTDPGPQSSTIWVWGLAQTTRDILTRAVAEAREQSYATAQQLRTACVQVYAGRPGQAGLLADDWILETPRHTRDGADWKTEIRCQDGRLPWASAFVNETVSPGTDPAALARAQQNALGLLGEGAEALDVDPQLLAEGFGRIRGNVVSFGPPRSNRQTLQMLNRTPIFQRGQIQWVRADTAQIVPAYELVEGRTALVVGDAEAYGWREVRAMLNPALELGRQVTIKRTDGRRLGPFRVHRVKYTGGTRTPEWYADLTLRPTEGTAALAEVLEG